MEVLINANTFDKKDNDTDLNLKLISEQIEKKVWSLKELLFETHNHWDLYRFDAIKHFTLTNSDKQFLHVIISYNKYDYDKIFINNELNFDVEWRVNIFDNFDDNIKEYKFKALYSNLKDYNTKIIEIHDPIIVSNREVVHSLEGCDYTDLSNFLKNVNVFFKKIDDGVYYKLIEIPTSWYEYHILNFLSENDDATLLLKNIDECYKTVFNYSIIKNVLKKYNIKNVTTVEAREEFSKIADSVILNMVVKHYIENYYVNAAKIGEPDNIKIIRNLTPIGKEFLKRSKMGKLKLFFVEHGDLFSSQIFIIFIVLFIMLVKLFLF